MSVQLCVHFCVISATHGAQLTALAQAESRTSDEFFYGSAPNRQQAWDRARDALETTCRDLAIEQHRFALPHGDRCFSEIADRIRTVRKLPFHLYGVRNPAEVRAFRDALISVLAEQDQAKLIASLPESRFRPETAARFLTMLRTALDAAADRFLAIHYWDGMWDEAPAGEPIAPAPEPDDLAERLARIQRAADDGRVSRRDYAALVSAIKRTSKRKDDVDALLDLAQILGDIEAKLSRIR